MLYRISTEWQPNLANLVQDAGFEAFAITQSVGYWKGKREIGAAIEIAIDDSDAFRVAVTIEELAKHIARVNKQEAILVTVLTGHSKLIAIEQPKICEYCDAGDPTSVFPYHKPSQCSSKPKRRARK